MSAQHTPNTGPITLTPGHVSLGQWCAIWRDAALWEVPDTARPAVEESAAIVASAASGDIPIYGINTGFGKLASVRIPAEQTTELQRNLIRSHCAGVGTPYGQRTTRLIMALKAASLGRGASGVRWTVIETLQKMATANILPVIPGQGSVGASGDLAPLAHMSAALIGEGDTWADGASGVDVFELAGSEQRTASAQALAKAGIAPVTLGPKEGLALINGTQVSTALALVGLFRAWRAVQTALVTGALSTDAAMGSATPFRAEIHELRGQAGQMAAAAALSRLMDGSEIRESHRDGDERVQDPYCIRCQPQVVGACLDLLAAAGETLRREANAVTDNPLILSDGTIASGGNFHAEPVAFAADQIALAMAEIGAIAQRRIALLVDPAMSFGLPPFLTPNPGINSGFMIAEVTSAALMSENKLRAMPASVDSTPTSANQEDHVSMACHGARRLLDMADNLERIVAIEALVAAQGVEFREPLKTSDPLVRAIEALRADVPRLEADRLIAPDIDASCLLVRSGALVEAAGADLMPNWDDVDVDRGGHG